MKKALWIGPIAHQSKVNCSKAISPAANVWQLGFIDGLIQNKIKVNAISYIPHPVWPRGPLWISKPSKKITNDGFNIEYVSYLNLFLIRWCWISLLIISKILSKFENIKKYFVFTYNPDPAHLFPAIILKFIYKITWISILADDYTKGKPDITLFLSYDYYCRYNKGEKYFLDGGVDSKRAINQNTKTSNRKILLYAGSQSKITGIEEFIKLYSQLKEEDYEVHIYGKGNNANIKSASLKDSRIKLFGFVSDDVLDVACCSADAFINPRSSENEANNTFPSKLLLYLSYKKPIISTDVPGISSKYDPFLLIYDSDDYLSFKNCISNLKKTDAKMYAEKVEIFKSENSWDNLVKKFIKHLS
jgi:glycosyltransferase involved in cell wall biosynthesis